MDAKKSFLIGIAGGTGSGKTTIARKIVSHFGSKCLYIPHDRYYIDRSHQTPKERDKANYDHPDALETELMIKHLKQLLNGGSVEIPVYDFTVHNRKKNATTHADPTPLIVVEGILIFENENLRNMFDLKIFVDVPADIRVLRKIDRDVRERGRTVQMSGDQYLTTTRPMHEKYVEPGKEFADIIIPQGGFNEKAVETLIHSLEKRIKI